MKKTLLLFLLIYGSVVSAKTYYVATTGSDNYTALQAENINTPWASWQKAVAYAVPGDIVYIRGGVYYPVSHVPQTNAAFAIKPRIGIGVSGTSFSPICYFAYPDDYAAGNFPILDCGKLSTQYRYNVGINIEYASWIHLKGLTVRNVRQTNKPSDPNEDQAFGIDCVPAANITVENCTVYNVMGRGYYFESWAWNSWDGTDGYLSTDTTRFINCDAYNLYDSLAIAPGNAADGFKCGNYIGGVLYFDGCRAWNYSDDGVDPGGAGKKIIKNCWFMSTSKYYYPASGWTMEGNGIKTCGPGYDQDGHYPYGFVFYEITNCIATNCRGVGIYSNLMGAGENYRQSNAVFYNNTVYHCRQGFMDGYGSVSNPPVRTGAWKNNLAYANTDATYDQAGIYYPNTYTSSNNTWISTGGSMSWPGWSYNPAVSVTDADFLSVDALQITAHRKQDGSLPDIDFLHLASGSDLIDAGANVGLPYSGTASDIGAFESKKKDPGSKPITSITVSGAGGLSAIITDNGTLQLSANVLPSDATNRTVTWSLISGSDKVSINSTGLVTALDNGTAVARATANDGSGVYGSLTLTIINQIIPVTGITVTGAGSSSVISFDDGTLQLSASILPANATNKIVTWSIISGPDKASISSTGLVTALENGTIVVSATANDGSGVYGSLTIIISNQVIHIIGLTVTGAGGLSAITTDNGTLQIVATVLPVNATNRTVTWSIASGSDKASISSTGLVTALDNGTVVARATANDGSGVYGNLTITISGQVILVTGITVTSAGGATLIASIGGTLQLSEDVSPANATNKTVTWSVASGSDKASISFTGLVTALDNGTAVARATANDGSGVYESLTITISDHAIPVTGITVTGAESSSAITTDNGTLQLSTAVLPTNASNKTVTWSITDGSDKASISPTGIVTALDNGTAVARATANDGSGIYGSLTITISNQVIPVTGITVSGAGGLSEITIDRGTLQLSATILPSNATNKTVSWSIVSGSDKASINSMGLVTALDNGTIVTRATANDGSGISGSVALSITNQLRSSNSAPVIEVIYKSDSYAGFIGELNASGSHDADKDNLTYAWTVPANIRVSSTSGPLIKYLCPVVASPESYDFKLNVSDGKVTESKNITITVLPYKPELEDIKVKEIEASGFQTPYYPYNIVDGNIGTMWAANGENQWLILKLSHLYSVQHVKIAFRQEQNFESYFDIMGSVDKVNWDPILIKSASCGFTGDIQVFEFPDSKQGNEYNFIKLVGRCNSADTWNYISEVKVFGYQNRNSFGYEDLPVKIYPNPAKESVTVRIDDSTLKPDFVQIIGASGMVFTRTKVNPDIRELTIPVNLKNGFYILQLLSGNKTLFSQKLIVRR